ncbi:MAG: esterase-like activity of phytase family protein [Verrucomicrobia bacterium]|nr:esterase-like activity of phytase family protein [Verrucomicrobiota bacterium]
MQHRSYRSPRPLIARVLAVMAAAVLPALHAAPVTVSLGGNTFVNHGLVGVGRLPASTKDKFGETFGSFSAFAFQPGSWKRNADGSYSGTLFAQPDRGYNAANTTNYTPRFNKIAVTFTPAADGAATQTQVGLTLSDSVKYTEADGTPLTSLDPVNDATTSTPRAGFPTLPTAYNNRISLDAEGIIVNKDGTLWVSDEYGPYVYKFSADGKLLAAIRPPDALIPKRGGADSFGSNTPGVGQPNNTPADPTTGRQNNQGLEGLSLSPDGRTLFTLLQSATRQDGGTGGSSATRFNTRLFAYDITGATPVLKAEYVFQLPTFTQGAGTRVAAQSDLLAINNTQFLVITRDSGNGHTYATPTSLYRTVCLYDISGATNIAGTAYDTAATPISPGGVLAAGLTPAQRTVLVDVNDATQLAKFGLHNGPLDDANNLSEKWEALALVPAYDAAAPNDYFLFVGNDNDFLTTAGYQDGGSYNAGGDNDSMILVYRLTLPGRLLNLSSRAQTGTGENVHIGGFVVNGPKPKTLLIRGVGPALAGMGVTSPLADPSLRLYNAAGALVASNDNWGNATTAADIAAAAAQTGAFSLANDSKDAALLITLDPGAYSAHVFSAGGSSGISLLEVYELP